MVFEGGYPRAYINKTLVSMDCDMMNNDGYAYAYVYSESPALNAGTYPTFYAADKATAVTSFSDYTTEVNEGGYKVHIYRLNILDQAMMQQMTVESDFTQQMHRALDIHMHII